MDCDCKRIHEELVFLFVDDEMGEEALLAFKRHIADCPECAEDAKYTRRLLMIVRERAGRCNAPRDLRDRILAALPHRRRFFRA